RAVPRGGKLSSDCDRKIWIYIRESSHTVIALLPDQKGNGARQLRNQTEVANRTYDKCSLF
ncbi:MAG TPA: hypothetical protein VLL05_16620, partial [Terriglobales bacterium]|nr:hypothetical protein [Terriglobales bacterium]